ncbi:putative carboxypeptidase S1 [Delitschia confertaspora ATCC 74209]|uniref:Carboxypeptidase n=1 Tax=Delitschia confertaspora ATCC 74209 TaxID=1513339 RepID=A0A9P4JJ44_9PLEO|nr:putative carboxypeptidase S1 [Delitschia confertaspora ATCC 74209]
MRFFSSFLASAAALAGLSLAAPALKDKRSMVERDGVKYNVFEHAATGAKIEFVSNSGICEKTPGVKQYSGYLSVGTNMNMWFWFFEARNNPTTAPLAAWFNGGPGCSSMIGLFQENGPCKFNVGSSNVPVNNTNSFNNYANMIYIDQPIGVGFSYGTDDVTSTETAAPYVWKLIQAFYASFPEYKSRDFGIFTESYGGHYGPEFAKYILDQNKAKAGENINLVALGINNGWFDATIQEKAYIQYSYNNTYKALISQSQYNTYMTRYTNQCLPALKKCTSSGSNTDCQNADNTCYNQIEGPLSSVSDFDVYDIRAPSDDPEPPANYATYLTQSSVIKAIGAKSTYQECPNAPYNKFASTGDNPRSFLDELSEVVSAGITTVIWAGDADWICNWFGVLDSANAIKYSGQTAFASKALSSYTVNGKQGGTFKTQDNLSFLRVFGAGHEVMYYQPALSLQVFKQTMQKQAIKST